MIGVRNMALDLELLSPEAREEFLALGGRHSTGSVIAQADKTLAACARHADALVEYGFGPDDIQVMGDGREESWAHRTEHAQTDGSRKSVTATASDAREAGRHERRGGRTVLGRGAKELSKKGNHDAARAGKAILKVTRGTPKDDQLPVHLETLLGALKEPVMAAVLVNRGGPQTVTRIENVLVVLESAMRGQSAHTPITVSSERRDIINGLLISLARDAYAAARLVARARKQPSIAAEFALIHLKRSRKAPEAPADPDAPVEIPAPADPLTP
jgi:hypothetical protein